MNMKTIIKNLTTVDKTLFKLNQKSLKLCIGLIALNRMLSLSTLELSIN